MSNTYATLFPYAKPPLGPAVAPIQGPIANISFPTGAYSSLQGGATYIPSTQFAGGMFNPYGTPWDAKQFLKGNPTSARLGAVSLTGPGANIEKLRYALLDPTQRAKQLSKLGMLGTNAKTAIGASPRLAGALSLGGKALPWLPVAGNVLEGDLVGTASSVGGGLIGGALTLGNPWGIAAGAALGEPIVRGGINLAAGIAGMDPNDPLSGPDWRIPWPGGKDPDGRDNDIAITPYARYLKREGREFDAVRRQYERLAPIREELRQADLSRQMQVAAMGQMGQMRAQSANMLQSMITGGY
tara:strand:+ start:1595 stop:2491 length:897 start_codon:yes stop_codon:yes gene_type:complete